MDIFGDLPTWAVLLLGIFCAAILMMLNLGWRSKPSLDFRHFSTSLTSWRWH